MGLGPEAGSVLCWKKLAPSQSSARGKTLSPASGDARAPSRGVHGLDSSRWEHVHRASGFSGVLNCAPLMCSPVMWVFLKVSGMSVTQKKNANRRDPMTFFAPLPVPRGHF